MRCQRLALMITTFLVVFSAKADGRESLEAIQYLIDRGHYRQAKIQIDQLLPATQSAQTRAELQFEAERMRRIGMEFTLDYPALRASIRRYIPDASEEDIQGWDKSGLLENMQIDGQRRYFNKAAYNLMHISDEAVSRSSEHQRFTDKAPLYALHPHHQSVVRAEVPLRNRFRVDYTLSVKADAVPAGEIIRAWLPFPKTLPGQQEELVLLAAEPAKYQLAPEQQAQRTIYFEKAAKAGEATEFAVSYAFDSLSRYTTIDAQRVKPIPADRQLAPSLAERPPHIIFTPELREISAKIVGEESNPYRIAQKLFAYVDAIPWAGAREYSTIRNISQYAAQAGHADCGQQTLLLMTLLRLNGIPSRWQSGWEFSPETFDTMHDWGEIYLAPYGWLPMDVTHGILKGKTEAENWFYLGGLDAFRLVFNTDYSQPFTPAKQHLRSETVDSQRGEVEWRGGNLYFDQWDYNFEWQIIGEDSISRR